MKILYNQAQLKRTLILGIVFTIIGFTSIFISEGRVLAGFVGIGLMYIVIALIQRNRPYILLFEDYIEKDGVFKKKKVKVLEIQSVKYFAGDYIIKTLSDELRIDTNLIDKRDLNDLHDYFRKYKSN